MWRHMQRTLNLLQGSGSGLLLTIAECTALQRASSEGGDLPTRRRLRYMAMVPNGCLMCSTGRMLMICLRPHRSGCRAKVCFFMQKGLLDGSKALLIILCLCRTRLRTGVIIF